MRSRSLTGPVFVFATLLVASGVACAKARPVVVAPEGPPLVVPAPPARVLEPVQELVSIPLAPGPEPESAPVAVAPPAPRRPAGDPRPQPAPPPAVAPPVPTAPRDLRTPSVATGEGERSVRDVLARAARDLGRVDYGQLSADGRAQYEQSRRFSAQAEDALRDRNLIFAATLADKAATLAAELLGR